MLESLLNDYLAGASDLHAATRGMRREQLAARPIAGQWSTLEVLCHIADSESLFAERIKRVLAEDNPPLPFADPNLFAPALAYGERDPDVELGMIDLTRRQIASILRAVSPENLTRTGLHSQEGPVSVLDVLAKAVRHLRHHLSFIKEKRRVLGLPPA